ncbi:MAG: chorismate synthase [Bacteroidetes bacterium HGW-Bacteroidetes-21]|jgi:chorismate synthase|nr:MAG: chorismate synthase [Bacteroidetes bacterium HGW-Bacteroidetes-21]
MNSFGTKFRISIFGESHGKAIGVVIDGCPFGIPLKEEDFIDDILRRKSGAKGTSQRIEDDIPEIISGTFNGHTTGAPITILFTNNNIKSSDYSKLVDTPRPGHADYTAQIKFGGFADYRGGGHFSGRLTLALVAAGVVAKKISQDVHFEAKLIEAGGMKNIEKALEKALAEKDSIGGIVECRILGLSAGLGEPFFDSAESLISHLAFSIPAIKGIEFGAGFSAASMKGSEHNDAIIEASGKTKTNNSGGINGGITNGNELVFRVAVKPTSSIAKSQKTLNIKSGKAETLEIKGRHDTCIALRVPVILEAVAAIIMTDLKLQYE